MNLKEIHHEPNIQFRHRYFLGEGSLILQCTILFCFDVFMVNFFCRYDDGYVVVGCWEDLDLRDSAYEGVAEETCNTDHEDTVDACTFANVRPHSEIVPKNV